MAPLHGTGVPHVETLGVLPWVQWGVIAVVLLVGCWLMLDVRGRSGGPQRLVDDQPEDFDGPLVAGRGSRQSAGVAGAPSAVGAPVGRSQPSDSDLMADDATESRTRNQTETNALAWSVVAGQRLAVPIWLNPIRVLTAILGIGAGVEAMDRARAITELDAMLGTVGTEQVARVALWLTVLLCVGGALAMPAPKLAAVAFVGAASLAAFFAVADWWESKLEWWGAEYALTAWSNLWAWVGVGLVLAGLALFGGWYRTGTRREA